MLQSLISLLPGSETNGRAQNHEDEKRISEPSPAQSDLGKWIWTDSATRTRNIYIYARKSFLLESRPTRAVLCATADSKYKVYVNGIYAGKGPVRSGEGYRYYDSYDITDLLKPGSNVVAFLVHHIGESTLSYIAASPGLICAIRLESNEQVQTIVTDETWKIRPALDWTDEGGRLSQKLGFQEVYDAGLYDADWNTVNSSEKGWSSAVVVGEPPALPWGELRPRQIPPLKEESLLPASVVGTYNSPEFARETPVPMLPGIMAEAALSRLTAGGIQNVQSLLSDDGVAVVRTPRGGRGVVVILDFGREVFGNIELGIADSGGGCIDLGYGELLEDGRVKPNRAETKYLDRVVLGRGRLAWQGFEPRGFRYLQLEFRGLRHPLALEYVRLNQTTYPVSSAGAFECSDSLLNEIWKTGAYTTQLCMEDTFIDCPWRGRAQWWGNARIESRVAYYAFGDTALLAQGLRHIADSQRLDGSIMGVYPSGEAIVLPDYSLIWVFSLLDYYAFSDDAALLTELYPSVRRLMEWFGGYEGPDGLLSDVPGWLFIDWADVEKQGEVTALNCYYYQALRVAGAVAEIAGSEEDGKRFLETADKLKRAINRHLYSPRRGLYAECRVNGRIVEEFSRQANALAALFDIPDHYQKSTIYRQLIDDALPEITTPYFMSYLLEALYAGERHEDALKIIRDKWGAMIEAGATTFWELFSQDRSLCHAWSACPTRDLLAEYVGIKPVLGAQRYTVAPHTGGLKWAKGRIDTPNGPLSVAWRAARNSLTVDVDVPEGTKADVYAPPISDHLTIAADGKTWRSRFVTLGPGSHRVRVTAERPPKPAATKGAPPPALVPQVEVLAEVSQRDRKRPLEISRTRRRTTAQDRKPEKAAPVETADAAVDESVAVPEVKPAEPEKKPRTRRRGGRGRSKPAAKPEAAVVEPQVEPQTEPETQATPEPPAAEESKSTEPASAARKPRRRGGRGRPRTARASDPEQTPDADAKDAEKQPSPDVPSAGPDTAAEEKPNQTEEVKRPRRPRSPSRARGPRRRKPADAAQPKPESGADGPGSDTPPERE